MRLLAYFAAFWVAFLFGFAALLLWAVPARAQEEAKGAELAALIERKCTEGCTVLSRDEMDELQAHVKAWVIEAHKLGQVACLKSV